MLAGWAWHERADAIVVYADLGITPGMLKGIEHAVRLGIRVVTRTLGAT